MANVFDYINDFFAGGEEALRNIEKELERSFIKKNHESYDSWFYSSSAITGVLLCTI